MTSDFIFITPPETTEAETEIYADVKWDYENDRPVFKNGEPVVIYGIEAVKSWAYRALNTRRYAEKRNSWDYGCDLYMLIGSPWIPETKIAEAKRYTEECLSQNPHITGISDFTADFSEDTVNISFTLLTEYGSAEINI